MRLRRFKVKKDKTSGHLYLPSIQIQPKNIQNRGSYVVYLKHRDSSNPLGPDYPV